jgi:hypothetical protein
MSEPASRRERWGRWDMETQMSLLMDDLDEIERGVERKLREIKAQNWVLIVSVISLVVAAIITR